MPGIGNLCLHSKNNQFFTILQFLCRICFGRYHFISKVNLKIVMDSHVDFFLFLVATILTQTAMDIGHVFFVGT